MSKYDDQFCPECSRKCKTLYRPYFKHSGPNLCYWCNKRRMKRETVLRSNDSGSER